MAGQTAASRTYWTQTMERYYLDLMLEHMHRGNRTGYTFNKQAWMEILAAFNSKFETQYDKDLLKSRYANLWKQFNDIKNILGQSGFSWDETKQMVVADDHVWDTYIKAYPDAGPYKNKVVQNFNDLCLVYCYTTADGRYSRSSHDLNFEDEWQGNGAGKLAPHNEHWKTDWTMEMDQHFVELMLIKKESSGNKVNNIFSKQAWTDILASFNAKFDFQHRKRVLRHRYRKLWKYYTDVTVLLRQNGFYWDNAHQTVAAKDDVWDAYIKAHPHMRPYKGKMLPNYNELISLFGDEINGNQTDLQQDVAFEGDMVGPKAAERSRTYWTPPMDRYFIDLLLEQLHSGNKVGQTFISQAWIDMINTFNSNFRSQYDKDVLKNRYKHLRKQYNDIQTLLGQSGFSWDAIRQMVTATDSVWESYLKAYPNARTYRVKTVPNYDKLCIIYGLDNSDGKNSHFIRTVNTENEASLRAEGDGKNEQSFTIMHPTSDWRPPMDHYFVDLLLEQSCRGNRINHTFDDQTWAHMTASFNRNFVLQYDRYVLEDRYMHLMKQYIDISSLLNQNGFFWDEIQQMVTAADDIWEAYTKVHPESIPYRNKAFEYYNDLCMIFGTDGIMDNQLCFDTIGTELVQNPQDLHMHMDEEAMDVELLVTDIDQTRKRSTEVSSHSSEQAVKIQKTGEMETHKACFDMSTNTKLVDEKDCQNYVGVVSAIDALQAIPGIDDELLLDACDLLEDERKAKTFLALDCNLRKKWLLRKLGRR